MTRLLSSRAAALLRDRAYDLARLLLVAWAVGLAIAAVQLGDWRQELTRTLLQLNADAHFRARVPHRDAVAPEWYRRKALSLLSATGRLHRDTSWTLFVPGSWRVFDDLEEQVQARVSREFDDIVVTTVRRELVARASELTGVPLARGSGDLQAGAVCRAPHVRDAGRGPSMAPQDLPEFLAVADYVVAVERLDEALQAFERLQRADGGPEHLRTLVAYTLGAELPGRLAQGVHLFRAPDDVGLQPALLRARLQWASRCALGEAMSALHARLLDANDLLALEEGLAAHGSTLFEARPRTAGFDRTLARYRTVHGLLEQQHALLARGGNDWMRNDNLQLGPAYQDVMQRITRTGLLGPEVVRDLQDQSGVAFTEFRRQFESAFGRPGKPGIVWLEQERRFALSPDRAALRTGLAALLKTPFMAEDVVAAGQARRAASMAAAAEDARALAQERKRFLAETLPAFPADVRPEMVKVVDARVSELIYEKAQATLRATLPAQATTPLDPGSFRVQRDQVRAVQTVLRETGGQALGERLVAAMDDALVQRLAVIHQDWRAQPLLDGASIDFMGWHGEPLAASRAIGAADPAMVPAVVSRVATRLDLLTRQAKALLALGSPALETSEPAQTWLHLQREMERYHARHPDSSLARLERYLVALGADLTQENCAGRLAAQLPRVSTRDEVERRHVQIHNALANRCNALRAQAPGFPPARE